MTKEEAEIIARIIGFADGGCQNCVSDLADRLTKAGLGFTFRVTQDYGVYHEDGNLIPVSVTPDSPPLDFAGIFPPTAGNFLFAVNIAHRDGSESLYEWRQDRLHYQPTHFVDLRPPALAPNVDAQLAQMYAPYGLNSRGEPIETPQLPPLAAIQAEISVVASENPWGAANPSPPPPPEPKP